MSNARNTSKLINKFSPTATGIDLTGGFSVSGDIGLTATSIITGGPEYSRVLRVHEANNSTIQTSTNSTLNTSQKDITLTSPISDDGSIKQYRLLIECYGNASYSEASRDPTFEPHLQVYNYATSAWANFSDTANSMAANGADGGQNVIRLGYYISGNLTPVSTANYILSYATPVRTLRNKIDGTGGTSNDTLTSNYCDMRVWELA